MAISKKPIYLLAGGRASLRSTQNRLLHIIYHSSGVYAPKIGYIGVANDDDSDFFQRTNDLFIEAGAQRVIHAPLLPSKSNIQKAQSILISSDIIYIAGGDVERGMQLLQDMNMIKFLTELYHSGKLFFGASAGSIMLAKEWVRWRDPDDDSSVELFPCLGFAPVICDTHDEQDDWQELQTALTLERNVNTGYGIVSGAGISVSPEGNVNALIGSIHVFTRSGNYIKKDADLKPLY